VALSLINAGLEPELVRLLDGGFAAWIQAELPTASLQ
jgi:rhodanese-related sulfurtransferase